MIYQWTTLQPVIGKIVRDVRHVDGSYLDDLTEWVAEAIGLLKTRYQLELRNKQVVLDFHSSFAGCLEGSLAAVIYQGHRLPQTGGVASMRNAGYRGPSIPQTVVNPSVSTPLDQTTGTVNYNNVTLQSLEMLPLHSEYFYRMNYNKIETNIREGILDIWYWAAPTDEDGFPMIPDNHLYKEAIYFYCRTKMIGTGFKDPVFKYAECESHWELYAARAIAEITYPTVDEVQRSIQTNVRLIPTDWHWESSGRGPSAEPSYYY